MSKKGLFKKGFSLVELLVVVSIMLVLIGIGAYSIGNFNRGQETLEARDYITDRIKLARSLAITNQLPDKTTDLKYVKVTILNGKLTVEAVKNDGTKMATAPYFSEDIDDSDKVLISITNNSISTTSFGFLGKTGRLVNGSGVLSNGPVVVKIAGTVIYSLTINDLGVINND